MLCMYITLNMNVLPIYILHVDRYLLTSTLKSILGMHMAALKPVWHMPTVYYYINIC